MTFFLRLTPADDTEIASAGRAFMTLFSNMRPLEEDIADVAPRRGPEWTDYATLILSLPQTVVAVAEIRSWFGSISKRKQLHERIEPILSAARSAPVGHAMILTVGGRSVDLGEVTTTDILEALADYEKSSRNVGR